MIAPNETVHHRKQPICYLLFVICYHPERVLSSPRRGLQRTRALIFRPLFMMLTWPEARRSATVATVSS
jgi:hypothetical protein